MLRRKKAPQINTNIRKGEKADLIIIMGPDTPCKLDILMKACVENASQAAVPFKFFVFGDGKAALSLDDFTSLPEANHLLILGHGMVNHPFNEQPSHTIRLTEKQEKSLPIVKSLQQQTKARDFFLVSCYSGTLNNEITNDCRATHNAKLIPDTQLICCSEDAQICITSDDEISTIIRQIAAHKADLETSWRNLFAFEISNYSGTLSYGIVAAEDYYCCTLRTETIALLNESNINTWTRFKWRQFNTFLQGQEIDPVNYCNVVDNTLSTNIFRSHLIHLEGSAVENLIKSHPELLANKKIYRMDSVFEGIIRYTGPWDERKHEDLKLLFLTLFKHEHNDLKKALKSYIRSEIYFSQDKAFHVLNIFLEIANQRDTVEILKSLTKVHSPGTLYEYASKKNLVHVILALPAYSKTAYEDILESVSKDGLNLSVSPVSAQSNFDIVMTAYYNNNDALHYADRELIKSLYRHFEITPDWNLIAKFNDPDILLAATEGIRRRFDILKMSNSEALKCHANVSSELNDCFGRLRTELTKSNKPNIAENAINGDISELYSRVISTKIHIPENQLEVVKQLCVHAILLSNELSLLSLRVNAQMREYAHVSNHLNYIRNLLISRPPVSVIMMIRDYINFLLPLAQRLGEGEYKDAQRLYEKSTRFITEMHKTLPDNGPDSSSRNGFFFNSGNSLTTINRLIDHAELCLHSDEVYAANQIIAEALYHLEHLRMKPGVDSIQFDTALHRIESFNNACTQWIENQSCRCAIMLSFLQNLNHDISETQFEVKDLLGRIKTGTPTGVAELAFLLQDLETIAHRKNNYALVNQLFNQTIDLLNRYRLKQSDSRLPQTQQFYQTQYDNAVTTQHAFATLISTLPNLKPYQ